MNVKSKPKFSCMCSRCFYPPKNYHLLPSPRKKIHKNFQTLAVSGFELFLMNLMTSWISFLLFFLLSLLCVSLFCVCLSVCLNVHAYIRRGNRVYSSITLSIPLRHNLFLYLGLYLQLLRVRNIGVCRMPSLFSIQTLLLTILQ